MAVIRVEKNKNYTVMSNFHLKDKRLSLKAKGILSLMLSLPDEWDYSINGLVAICKENRTSVKNALNELKEFGYLVVYQKYPNQTISGRFEYEYIVFENPKQESEKQGVENLGVEFLGVENHQQLNTKQLNTKKSNTKYNKEEDINSLINDLDDDLKSSLQDFLKMRKAIKKPMTTRAVQLLLNELNKLSNSKSMQIAILQQSILNGWQSVYPLKVGNKGQLVQRDPNEYNSVFEDFKNIEV